MTKLELIKKCPELYLDVIRDGVELALNGRTEFHNVTDVQEEITEIKKKWDDWEQQEIDFLKLI
jgi:hypothetical protein